jgi:hypothetical protein
VILEEKELCYVHRWPSIVTTVKGMKIEYAGHMTKMGKKDMCI